MRILIVLCAYALLSGCVGATIPVENHNALTVPQSAWKTQNYRAAGENTGVFKLQRDTGMRGSACKPFISLDGENIAQIDVGQKLELHLNAGPYLVRASPNHNCAATTVETVVEINEGYTTIYRLGFVDREMILIPAAQ